jgi:hypothetical protein
MLHTIQVACPYCSECAHAYDSDTGAIVLNPDRGKGLSHAAVGWADKRERS